MPLGPLSFLSLGARIAQPFIRLGIRLGRTVGQIAGSLGRAGVRIEAATTRRIVEAERRLAGEVRTVLGRPTSEILDSASIPEAITRQRRMFAWRIRLGIVNPATGVVEDRFFTVSTDDLLSADDALSEAQQSLDEDYGVDSNFIVDSEVVEVTRAAPGRRL